MINFEPTAIAGAWILAPDKFGDERGFFSETFRASLFKDIGVEADFVQDNHSFTAETGTLRGLHFQAAPNAQAKLVRVTRGRVLDVAVDIREGSPTYGKHVAVELSRDNWRQLFVPVGLAHGYLTLTEDCEVLYKTTDYYTPSSEGGLLWSDPALEIQWPIPVDEIKSNARDRQWPTLRDLQSPFTG